MLCKLGLGELLSCLLIEILVCIKETTLLMNNSTIHSVIISLFAIVILSILGGLYRNNHHEFLGGVEDPKDGKAVAGTVFTAVIVYAVSWPTCLQRGRASNSQSRVQVFLVFCGLQGLLHLRENRRGAIALS